MKLKQIVPLGIATAGVGLLAALAPSALSNHADIGTRRDRQVDLERDLQQLEIEESLASQRRELAESRYQNGCVFVVVDATYVTLPMNAPIINAVSGFPIPANTAVCDVYGNTATVGADGVPIAETFAFSGNTEVINAARDRANSNGQFARMGGE